MPAAGGEAKALTSGIAWDMQPRYSGMKASPGDTLQCRTYHAIQALGAPNDPLHCPAAFGADGTECN